MAVERLSEIIQKTEQELWYRDRLPDTMVEPYSRNEISDFDWNFSRLIMSATGGRFGTEGAPAPFNKYTSIPSIFSKASVAIIGAGPAGLAAGFELMKLGLDPVFYEMQVDEVNPAYARPMGRVYSWDYGAAAQTGHPGFSGWHPPKNTDLSTGPKPNDQNVHPYPRNVAEFGAMRFPATNLALRTYVDKVFTNAAKSTSDYYYGDTDVNVTGNWRAFRDPGAFAPASTQPGPFYPPNDSDKLQYSTVYYTKGVPKNPENGYSQSFRLDAGTEFKDTNEAFYHLTNTYYHLLYNQDNGILYDIVTFYEAYTKATTDQERLQARDKIVAQWKSINEQYDGKSLFEVLTESGWADSPAYLEWDKLNISQLEMFGEMGTGTGPFNMFFYSSFMESLRIALHEDDSGQDYFVGGASYMLSPFLTHNLEGEAGKNLWSYTNNRVVKDPVVSLFQGIDSSTKRPYIAVTSRNRESGSETTHGYTAVILTAPPSAIRSRIMIDPALIGARALSFIKRVRLTNSSKIALNFPNVTGQKYSQAFWMNRTSADPYNTNADSIVTTLTDSNIRQIYTFDNYHWGTGKFASTSQELKAGTLMLSYAWDYNADAWAGLGDNAAVLEAWNQMKEIYAGKLPDDVDEYLAWAIKNDQARSLVWTKVDGFAGGWRMAQPGRNVSYGSIASGSTTSEWQAIHTQGITGVNEDTGKYTGLHIAGEATAWEGLSGWSEGAIQTALQAVSGILLACNVYNPLSLTKVAPTGGTSFSLPNLPGETMYIHKS